MPFVGELLLWPLLEPFFQLHHQLVQHVSAAARSNAGVLDVGVPRVVDVFVDDDDDYTAIVAVAFDVVDVDVVVVDVVVDVVVVVVTSACDYVLMPLHLRR
jgi:hypothetical protein